MKKFLVGALCICLALFVGYSNTKAQNVKREGNTFISQKAAKETVSSDIATSYTWKDNKGVEYPIFLHKYVKGEKEGKYGAYVIKQSAKTGKEYKYYIPDNEEIVAAILKEMGI